MSNQVENPDSRSGLNQNTVTSGIENNEKTIDIIKQRADLGDAEAQAELGIMFYEGKGVETDFAQALKYFKLSADQGNTKGQFFLGGMYLKGVGVECNYEEAFKYLKLSADQGNSESQFCVGALYKAGKGITKDYKEAIKYFKLSADQGHKDAKKALNELEHIVSNSKNNTNSKEENNNLVSAQTELVEQIDKIEQNFQKNKSKQSLFNSKRSMIIIVFLAIGLIIFFLFFKGDNQNEVKNNYLIKKTQPNNSESNVLNVKNDVEKSYSSDALEKGLKYENLQDYGEAIKYYKLATEHNSISAKIKLALLGLKYYEGKGIKCNLEEANNCFKYSGFQDNLEKQKILNTLGILFFLDYSQDVKFDGKDVNFDGKNGYILADHFGGLAEVLYGKKNKEETLSTGLKFFIGEYLNNKSIEAHYDAAYDIFKILLILGDTECKNLVYGLGCGLVIGKGSYGETNLPEAIKYIKLSAEFGLTEAEKTLYEIGLACLFGNDPTIKKDYVMANEILKYLVERGNIEAQQLLLGVATFWITGKDNEGKAVELNYSEAANTLQFLADKGNKEIHSKAVIGMNCAGAFLILGKNIFYNREQKIDKNIPKGVELIKLANSYNNPEVQKMMKEIYNNADKGDPDAQEIVRALNNESLTTEEPKSYVDYGMNNNKVYIDLKDEVGGYALGAANVVKDFYTNYLNHDCRIDNWEANKNLMPLTRQIFLMLKHTDFYYLDYDFIVQGQDYGNIWKINTVQVKANTALVGVESSFNGEGSRNLKIVCKYVNGKWFIDDIEDSKKLFYSFLNGNLNLGVVNSYELPIFSKKYNQQNLPFYDIKNRIIPLKFNSLDYYQIDSSNGLGNKIDSTLSDSEWFVKSESVIPFNFLNIIRKGESKYLAYIVLGEPAEDSSNKLFYSPNDYISYDSNGKITSWTGFEDLKDFFDDGTGLNNQNIGYVNAKSGINLRKEPNTKSEKVLGLPFNCQVMILNPNGPQATFEKITSNWYLITDGTKVGWAFGGFIRKEN